jgi:hypothetical protein
VEKSPVPATKVDPNNKLKKFWFSVVGVLLTLVWFFIVTFLSVMVSVYLL